MMNYIIGIGAIIAFLIGLAINFVVINLIRGNKVKQYKAHVADGIDNDEGDTMIDENKLAKMIEETTKLGLNILQ